MEILHVFFLITPGNCTSFLIDPHFSEFCHVPYSLFSTPHLDFIWSSPILNLSPMQHQRWSSLWQKKCYWLIVVTYSFYNICDRSDTEMHRWIQIKAIEYSICHLHNQIFTIKNTGTMCQMNSKWTIDTRTTSDSSIVNIEYVLHLILLLIMLNLGKC